MVALTEKLNLMALRLHLGLFTFNPFGVGAWGVKFESLTEFVEETLPNLPTR